MSKDQSTNPVTRAFLASGMSTRELARQTGIEDRRIVKIMSGSVGSIYLAELRKLAHALFPSAPVGAMVEWIKEAGK